MSNNYHSGGGGQQPDYFDDEPYESNSNAPATFEDHDPYARHSSNPNSMMSPSPPHHPHAYGGGGGGPPMPEQPAQQYHPSDASPPPRRRHKYSTSDMNETRAWKKWCYILGLFLFFLAFMIGLSILFQHFFFGDVSDNGPTDLERDNDNSTFSKDKQEIDSACGRSTFQMDNGELCTEACVPHFFKCCDPFDEFDLYGDLSDDTTEIDDVDEDTELTDANATKAPKQIASRPKPTLANKNTTFLDAYNNFDDSTCSLDRDLRGCMAYAKCQALGGQVDPAPANLPDMCSLDRLDKDDESCKELCTPLKCCYSQGSDNCMAEKFDLCMDYAPCQNLRYLDDLPILPTAPRTLDYDCYWQQPSCHEECKIAECCNAGGADSCLQFNFMSCLTYAPCNNVTDISIVVEPQFNKLRSPPKELVYACNAHHEAVLEPTDMNCEGYCKEAACCWDGNFDINCFNDDPLGCLAWEAQCQVLLNGPPEE